VGLRAELYLTATLVLDAGVHVHGWSADQARSFFIEQMRPEKVQYGRATVDDDVAGVSLTAR